KWIVCYPHLGEAVFYRFDALGSMSFVLWVLAAEWIPDNSLRLVRNDMLLIMEVSRFKCHSR
ncbi:hypothetical protein M2G67_22445, partial [Vibrio vulnificus]|nr:hypothetical protein [Vibrio vulnificus]